MLAPETKSQSVPCLPETMDFQTTCVGSTHLTNSPKTLQLAHVTTDIVLATAIIPVYDIDGSVTKLRALLDSGSSATFITERAMKKLRLVRCFCDNKINVVGEVAPQNVNGCTTLRVVAFTDTLLTISVDVMILNRVVGILPATQLDIPSDIFDDCRSPYDFADPNWNIPAPVDILLGADVYYKVVTGGILAVGSLTLIETIFGYGVCGPIASQFSRQFTSCGIQLTDYGVQLEKFWQIEEVPEFRRALNDRNSSHQDEVICKSTEEEFAERHFLQTCNLDSDGRVITTLPFFGDVTLLGNSERLARLRFLNLEQKLEKMPQTYQQYRDFMQEFIDLGHMELVPDNELNLPDNKCYYIPHHCVRKEDSTTTKLRVVFDASASTSTRVSLNDVLAAGPKLQDDLFHIMIRFRFPFIALIGDIAKMYRQVKLDLPAQNYHRLFWRRSYNEPLLVYRMTRVTYGVKSASHSSIKALQLTADRFGSPATRLSIKNMYVDDWFDGGDTTAAATDLVNKVITTLQSGGFELRKLASSDATIVNSLPERLRENIEAFEFHDEDHSIKTLGITWLAILDTFMFKVKHLDIRPESSKDLKRAERSSHKTADLNLDDQQNGDLVVRYTRRQILSDISKIFDPLGFLAPSIVTLKICMQDIWKTKLGWDEPLPCNIVDTYLDWRSSLHLLRECRIPRKVLQFHDGGVLQLHVFCDASEKAYGAVAYIRESSHESVHVAMLASKSKVAPIKSLTIPKLELCAALTGVRLIQAIMHALRHTKHKPEIFAWSDSTTVLHWLSGLPGKWQTFVSNRVAQIQETVPRRNWYHVPTELNPADLASRGMPVADLLDSKLWWKGPDFLHDFVTCFPAQPTDEIPSECAAEERKVPLTVSSVSKTTDLPSFLNLIDLTAYEHVYKVCNILALVLRFVAVLRKQAKKIDLPVFITSNERRVVLARLTKAVQDVEFSEEIALLEKGCQLPRRNRLSTLYPFVDPDDGLLKVGGRLQARSGSLSDHTMYPAILPKKAHLSLMLATRVHRESMHGGLQLCIGELRRNFWVISSRQLFRELIRNCTTCFRYNSRPLHQLMGDLPRERVTPSQPFTHTGLDYAGPIASKSKDGTEKVYLAIFVCFSTKAVHIEVVSSLTSHACIAAIRRFVARRGVPSRLYSDNATNFMGARSDLVKLQELLHKETGTVTQEGERLGMSWVFIPPGSPNFGGLWEAAVKSAKSHMKKVVGKAVLTFEELVTLCCDIESIMNSRPLVPLTDDANDFGALTPFMLLTGRQSKSLPMLHHQSLPSNDLIRSNPTKRWLHVRNITADFWRRWNKEYLTTLQQRPKHTVETPNLQVNDLVLLTDEKLPPLQWPLGRIVEIYPGNDGQVRAVLVRTQAGVYKRPAYKARRLPNQLH